MLDGEIGFFFFFSGIIPNLKQLNKQMMDLSDSAGNVPTSKYNSFEERELHWSCLLANLVCNQCFLGLEYD